MIEAAHCDASSSSLPEVRITNVAAAYNLKEWDKQQQAWIPWDVALPEFLVRTNATQTVFCTNLYHEERFPAVKLVLSARRQHVPLVTFLYFKKGKVVQIGAKSEAASRMQTALFVAFVLRVFHQEIRIFDFKITNICVSGKLRGPLDLHALNRFLKPKGRSSYQPSTEGTIDSFPALIGIVNPAFPKRIFTLYTTGSFNLVGNKKTLDWQEGQQYMAFIGGTFQATEGGLRQQKKRGLLQRERLEEAQRHILNLSQRDLLEPVPRPSKRRRLTSSPVDLLE